VVTRQKVIDPNSITYDESMERFEVLSDSHAGHRYSVYWDPIKDMFVCTCPHGRSRGRMSGNQCKHVKGVVAWLMENPTRQVWKENHDR
jgi:hypothetical protein